MRFRRAFFDRLIVGLSVCLFRVLFLTLRVRFREVDPRTHLYARNGPTFIYSFWHDAIVYSIFAGRHRRTTALVSKHQDGSWLAGGLALVGVGLVRGSSGKSGAAALRQLLAVPIERNVVITPDGPRGPRHQAKPGLIFLASRSGRAVVPGGFAAVRSWRIPGSWTDLEIPKPFTTVYFVMGPPIAVPADASREVIAGYEAALQSEMERLTAEATDLAAGHRERCDTGARGELHSETIYDSAAAPMPAQTEAPSPHFRRTAPVHSGERRSTG
jgi:lysophospholipid acyltransferase (LPLAT)-like uncharacterized protein